MTQVARSTGWRGYVVAAFGVAAMTGAIHLLPGAARIANISLLYLLVVMSVALRFGSGAAVAASVLAFLGFDFFFVEPLHTFTVRDPAEWLALIVFLITAVVTGHLTAALNARAEEARRSERETTALADASLAVASHVNRDRALAEVLRRLEDVISPEAAAIVTQDAGGQPELAAGGAAGMAGLPDFGRDAAAEAVRFVLQEGKPVNWGRGWSPLVGDPGAHPEPGSAYLPLTTEGRVLGVLFLRLGAREDLSPSERRVVDSLVSQAAIVLERDRLARAETATQALREADRLKTALLSMISHDFRSPLTSIKASVTGLLQEGVTTDPMTQRELLQGVDQETDRLNRMVGNILALSRLEADAWRPMIEPTPIGELLEAAMSGIPVAGSRRIDVRVDPGVDELDVDLVQIAQVLHNLLDNALKYSAPDTRVELVVTRQAGEFVLEVVDRGRGFAPQDSERIFEPFYRAPELQESALPGVGIGLAVCRGLAEAHGGRLTASPREAGGSTFRLSLPRHGLESSR